MHDAFELLAGIRVSRTVLRDFLLPVVFEVPISDEYFPLFSAFIEE